MWWLMRQSLWLTPSRLASSYVSRMRTLDWWKNDDSAVKAEFTRGQFVLFLDKRPLVRRNKVASLASKCTCLITTADAALLDASEPNASSTAPSSSDMDDFTAIFAVGLSSQKSAAANDSGVENLSDRLAAALDGKFIDARLAMLSMEWTKQAKLIAKGQAMLRWNKVYRKCPKCGTGLEMKLSKTQAHCTSCDRQYYPTLSPVAICLIRDESDEHCLLVRQPQTRKGVFTAVAGFCEPGESLEDAARREIAEEVGIDLLGDVLYGKMSQPWPFPNSSLMCSFVCIADRNQQPEVDHSELEAAKWFSKEEVAAAFHATVKDPFLSSPADDPHHLSYIPPQGTIAHHMIKQWLRIE